MKNLVIPYILFFYQISCVSVLAQNEYDLWMYDPATGVNTELLNLRDAAIFNPDWSNDGRQVIFDVISDKGSQTLGTFSFPPPGVTYYDILSLPCANNASFNGDATEIIYDKVPCEDSNLYHFVFSTGIERVLISDAIDGQYNKRVCCSLISFTRPSEQAIYVYNFITGEEHRIAQGMTAKWNSLGSSLTFTSGGDVHTIGISTSGAPLGSPRLIYDSLAEDLFRPEYFGSNDIVYFSNSSGSMEIFSVRTFGTPSPINVVSLAPGNHLDPDYSQTSRKIAYSSNRSPCMMECGSLDYIIVKPCTENQIVLEDFFGIRPVCSGLTIRLETLAGDPVPNPVPAAFFCQDLWAHIQNEEGTYCLRTVRVEQMESIKLTEEYIGMTWQQYWHQDYEPTFVACSEVTYTYEDFEMSSCDIYRYRREYLVQDICGNKDTITQFIDIIDYFQCGFAGNRQFEYGMKGWMYLDLPENSSSFGWSYEWIIDGDGWSIVDFDAAAVQIEAGAGSGFLKLELTNNFGFTHYLNVTLWSTGQFSMANRSSDRISIAPNPAIHHIDIAIPELTDMLGVQVLNMQGQMLKNLDREQIGSRTRISLKDQAAGFYLVRINKTDAIETIKFVKE